jgi:hypothetical protein
MLSLAFGVTPVKPQGYALNSSECASTFTVTVLAAAAGFVSRSPKSTARRPSGAQSVRSRCRPPASGSAKRV